MTTLVWFRQDLRIADNPALFEAAKQGDVVPVFIFEEGARSEDTHPLGSASHWWLHHSLKALQDDLGNLLILKGNPAHIIPDLAGRIQARAVYWNRCYEPYAISRDSDIKADLKQLGLDVKSFKASVLFEPFEVETGTGGPYKVYSPFWRAALKNPVPAPLPRPEALRLADFEQGLTLEKLGLLPEKPDWASHWTQLWAPGEQGAMDRLKAFLANGLRGYATLRDRPDKDNVSRLSAALHFGEISPRQIWQATQAHMQSCPTDKKDGDKFLSEVGWREFAYHLLYHFPYMPERNWKPDFDAYPWQEPGPELKAWQQGQTGYPIVDAGMRELWQTGWMHNRVRMIVASFLIKHLRLHWSHGEAWFRDTLVDADLANNVASWQWVAGSGADAAPYFRIFNPMTQGRKFDPDGAYVRRWVPELAKLDNKVIHAPFEAPESELVRAGVVLGKTYPRPIVDHAQARAAALAGYDEVKNASNEQAG